MEFSSNLKQLRIQHKLTLQDMGDLLGVSRQAYTKYENGEAEPNYENLIKIADQFNVTVDFLL
jgi:transcriptional regulator with XRE-family HTH domain